MPEINVQGFLRIATGRKSMFVCSKFGPALQVLINRETGRRTGADDIAERERVVPQSFFAVFRPTPSFAFLYIFHHMVSCGLLNSFARVRESHDARDQPIQLAHSVVLSPLNKKITKTVFCKLKHKLVFIWGLNMTIMVKNTSQKCL
jgi:hypothetical protein